MRFRKKILLFLLLLTASQAVSQVTLYDRNARTDDFPLVRGKTVVPVCYSPEDAGVVALSAGLFSADVERVTGRPLPVHKYSGQRLGSEVILTGTIGSSPLIDGLIRDKKIDVSQIDGKWECYLIEVVKNPLPGVRRALVVAGSDRRGTAYGLLRLSETIGVSPWYWWADVPVQKREELRLSVGRTVSREPSVRYRGLFINDEDWGLLPWAKKTFDPELGNIGPKTYEKVCELLLRLKGNYLCPAMHEASTAFNRIPENKAIADYYAIVMGSVHCEPLLFNNASEWKKETMGEWDYINNHESINRVLRRRVQENSAYENVYTLALRGLHDRAMTGSTKMSERVQMLGDALMAQRQIVADVHGKPAHEIPQAFTPYKEVLDVYSAGLDLPDDVTIIWPDDNYGYMKRLSGPTERERSGRSGVYYHASYLGKPHDYLWLSSTYPALMYEELKKAYDATADRIWLMNVGDIKSCEFPLTLFLEMAYDIDAFSYENIADFKARWLADMFGEQYYEDFHRITNEYFRLAFARKPEFMGFGYEWNTNRHGRERVVDTDFSIPNYGEFQRRWRDYERIGADVEALLEKLPETHRSAFYQLLYYPVRASELMNKVHLTAQKNRVYGAQGRASANILADDVKMYHDSLRLVTQGYNELENGKWNHVMSLVQGVTTSYFELPKNTVTVDLPATPVLGIQADGEEVAHGLQSFHALPAFNPFTDQKYGFDIYNKGKGTLEWSVKTSGEWIVTDKSQGSTAIEERVGVTIDWNKVPAGERVLGEITVTGAGSSEKVLVSVFQPSGLVFEQPDSLWWIEDNGVVSIPAAGFNRKVENEHIDMRIIHNLGYEDVSVQLGDPMAPKQNPASSIVPRLEYDFWSFGRGSVDVYTYVLPTFPLTPDTGYAGHESTDVETQYGVIMNDGILLRPSTSSFEYAHLWYDNVMRNCRVNKTTHYIDKPGKNTIHICCATPGVVIQKIVIDFGGMKRSYQGPPPTAILPKTNL